jgi:hypothetical protein
VQVNKGVRRSERPCLRGVKKWWAKMPGMSVKFEMLMLAAFLLLVLAIAPIMQGLTLASLVQ